MNQKSCVEFVLGAYDALLVDCASQYPELTKEFDRDFVRLSSAAERHGEKFFLETMPAFRKHFDKCLDQRRLTSSRLIHFGSDKRGGVIPRLFRGLILRVFDRSGVMRHEPDGEAIRLIRQLLGVVRKLRKEASIRDRGNAVREFFRLDQEVKYGTLTWDDHTAFDTSALHTLSFAELHADLKSKAGPDFFQTEPLSIPPSELLDTLQQVADLVSSQLGVFNAWEWKPRHGPGAVSDRKFGSYKYEFDCWPERLERAFPYADFAHANYACANPLALVDSDTRGLYHEFPAKLCAVPKTITTPRLIAAEPVPLQWCQQILRDYFYKRVESTFIGNFVDFRRQELNGDLALQASIRSSHATIDLSSASDRISCWHVERLFRRLPSLVDSMQASRSAWIEQDICRFSPKYAYIRKYSTMGNATTFPVQSLFFVSLALASLCYVRKLPVNYTTMRKLGRKQVRVFGDDIIVPADCSGVLLELLKALSLKVNPNKTFTDGNFRESCGVDAYGGHDVTTVSILDVPRGASPGSIVSSVDVHNNLCEKGMMHLAAYIRKTAGRIARNRIRFVQHGSGLFGWSSLYGEEPLNLKVRWNRSLQRREVQCLKLRVSEQRASAKETAGLLQFFTEAPSKVTSAVSTLGYLTRRPKVGLTLGWAPAY